MAGKKSGEVLGRIWLEKRVEDCFPFASFANRSSGLGIGYLSSRDTGFTVTLKSPQIRLD